MLVNGVNLMHHLSRCRLRLRKHMLEEKQLVFPSQLMQPKNSVEAIHQLFHGIVGGWLPLSFSVALTGLEILVAFLQAYVFAILTCIYLNDALNLHH